MRRRSDPNAARFQFPPFKSAGAANDAAKAPILRALLEPVAPPRLRGILLSELSAC
jgi:hypothetical protein